MTTDTERIAALEAKVTGLEKWLESIDGKVDQLVGALNMSKGGFYVLLKIGAALVGLAAIGTWLTGHLHWR